MGALCAITARDGDAESAMLASWISQVPFTLELSISLSEVCAACVSASGLPWAQSMQSH